MIIYWSRQLGGKIIHQQWLSPLGHPVLLAQWGVTSGAGPTYTFWCGWTGNSGMTAGGTIDMEDEDD